tara:strand:- start:60 stop:974 length:915 start_codon:yes stop_codon:yes gene_type:complete
MADDEPSKMDSFKDKLSDLGQKVGEVSKKAAKKTSEVGANIAEDIKTGAKKVSEDVKVGAKKVSETVDKKRDEIKEKKDEMKKAKAEADDAREDQLIQDLRKSELFPLSEYSNEKEKDDGFVKISIEEYRALSKRSENQVVVPQVMDSFEVANIEKIPNETLTVELSRSINEILQTLGVSVLFAAILVGLDYYLDSNPTNLGPLSADLLTWPLGTGIWSYYILHRLARFRTFLSMPLGMRIQTAVGVGLATELAMLLSSDTVAITNIWGWTGLVALTAILLSGLLRGFAGSFGRLFSRGSSNLD